MGRAGQGRPAKPTELKLLHGDKKSRINTDEPTPASGDIKPPSSLGKEAKKVWNRLAPDLIAKGVLTSWDVDEFAQFCDAVERAQRAAKNLDEQGEVVDDPVYNRNGERTGTRPSLNKWWHVWKGANEAMLRYGARFGMSPSDRSSIKVGPANNGGKGPERFFS